MTDLDYPVACRGVLGTTEDPFGSSLVVPLSSMDNKTAFAKACINIKGM